MATEQKKQSKVCEEKTKEEPLNWRRVPSVILPTSAFANSNVYKTEAEMNAAVRNGTFNLNKTMVLKNGKLFFLCHE